MDLMFFSKKSCKRCQGTGVSDLDSYYLGSHFFLLGVDLALPLVMISVPLYLLSLILPLDFYQILSYWRILMWTCLLAFVLCLWFVTPLIKKLLFGVCANCGGTGKAKKVSVE